MRVSNVAAAAVPAGNAASHSRRPTESACTVPPDWSAAARRVAGRVIPKACVGPPTTMRSTSDTVDGASVTSVVRTVMRPASPVAIASAIARVLPNTDSTTTNASMIATSWADSVVFPSTQPGSGRAG